MSNEPDEVNSGALATAILLVAFTTLAIALVVTALVRSETKALLAEKDQTQEHAYRNLRAQQDGSLIAAPAWTDRAKGLVSVPIDRAIDIVLADLARSPYALSPGLKKAEEDEEDESPQGDADGGADGEATEDVAADEPNGQSTGADGKPAQADPAPANGSTPGADTGKGPAAPTQTAPSPAPKPAEPNQTAPKPALPSGPAPAQPSGE